MNFDVLFALIVKFKLVLFVQCYLWLLNYLIVAVLSFVVDLDI